MTSATEADEAIAQTGTESPEPALSEDPAEELRAVEPDEEALSKLELLASREDLQLEVAEVPMTLDCQSLSPAQLAEAVEAGDCRDPHGPTGLRDSKTGNCGRTYLYAYNAGNRKARFTFGATSFKGVMLNVSYAVNWVNTSPPHQRSAFAGSQLVKSTRWNDARTVFTGKGRICGTLSGGVQLASGGRCAFLKPFSCADVRL